MENNIKEGSYVKHVNPQVNNSLRFEVDSINEENQSADCYIGGELQTFPLADLIYLGDTDGGWID